ncbi:serine/arginine repetitive matrix protein 1-like [Bos mutus]|uniref:serine/arginine repetitive matrix protein 1-like n=1 Tax=Bos mutus TaxID=72004 RepID=UPI0038B60DC7
MSFDTGAKNYSKKEKLLAVLEHGYISKGCQPSFTALNLAVKCKQALTRPQPDTDWLETPGTLPSGEKAPSPISEYELREGGKTPAVQAGLTRAISQTRRESDRPTCRPEREAEPRAPPPAGAGNPGPQRDLREPRRERTPAPRRPPPSTPPEGTAARPPHASPAPRPPPPQSPFGAGALGPLSARPPYPKPQTVAFCPVRTSRRFRRLATPRRRQPRHTLQYGAFPLAQARGRGGASGNARDGRSPRWLPPAPEE